MLSMFASSSGILYLQIASSLHMLQPRKGKRCTGVLVRAFTILLDLFSSDLFLDDGCGIEERQIQKWERNKRNISCIMLCCLL